MSINATIDSTTYEGVETITVGGKSIALTATGGGSGGAHSGTFTLVSALSTGMTIPHGCGHIPSFFMIGCVNPSNTSNLRRYIMRSSDNKVGVGIYGGSINSGTKENVTASSAQQAYAYADATDLIMPDTVTAWAPGDYLWMAQE